MRAHLSAPDVETFEEYAARLGREAFKAGRMRVPVLDPAFCALLKGQPKVLPLLDAWLHAWDRENLSRDND